MYYLLLITLTTVLGCSSGDGEDMSTPDDTPAESPPPLPTPTPTPTPIPLDTTDNDLDGFSEAQGDCNDANAVIRPGAPEVCNGVDDDCDGLLDDGVTDTVYLDIDDDGYGDGEVSAQACSVPLGYSGVDGDCDDGDAEIYPGAVEACDQVDQDCDGQVDEGFDVDGDGFTSCGGDCDDSSGSTYPEAAEVCDRVDQDCNGVNDDPWNADGDPAPNCGSSNPYGVLPDCDDNNPVRYPGASEVCDGGDQNCDNVPVYAQVDNDDDGFYTCYAKQTDRLTDCFDSNAFWFPGGSETLNDIADANCNGFYDK